VDSLASEGIAFEQFYVNSPICSPSRVAISTGTYPQRWKITSYLAHRKDNASRGMANWLNPEAPMLARSLKAAGYATGHFGKWHMGGQRDVTKAPPITAYGFDESLTNFEGLGPKLLPLTLKPGGQVGKIWADAEQLGGPVTWMQRSEITSGFIDKAIPFMENARRKSQPFYVNLWPDDVHSPFWPPVDTWGDGSNRRRYLSVLEAMDTQLGRLFAYVRNDPALRENTLIVLCSDNGCEKGAGQAEPFKGYKTHLYEGGIRSPLIVWGPGVMAASAIGSRNKDSVFCAMDLVPSLLAIAGVQETNPARYDGENLSPVLLGHSQDSRSQPIFFSRPPDRKSFYGFENLPDLAVRDGKWKLLCDYDGRRPQLYDLFADPGETKSLADAEPDVTAALSRKVVDWHRTISREATPGV
jgi:arylsulfatase A-like enzyme